jgi:hypothetical protein
MRDAHAPQINTLRRRCIGDTSDGTRRSLRLAEGNRRLRADEDTRKVIALRIVDCAKSGEREPSRLKAYALAGFSLVGRSKNTVRTTHGVGTIAADRERTGA